MAKPVPAVELTFDINKEGAYATFISELRSKLQGTAGKKVEGRPVLDVQTSEDKQPPRWINVVLRGGGTVAPKIAIRSDNAYIAGFTNIAGKWFQLKNEKNTIILPTAKALNFTGSYKDLIGTPDVNIPKLQLGMSKTLGAAGEIWKHGQNSLTTGIDANDDVAGLDAAATDDAAGASTDLELIVAAADPQQRLKSALATLAVTLCEAARIIPVYGTINSGWANNSAYVNASQVKYINKWGQLSEALLGWNVDKNDSKWFKSLTQSTGISTGTEALKVVHLILNNPPKVRAEDGIGAFVEEEEAPVEGED